MSSPDTSMPAAIEQLASASPLFDLEDGLDLDSDPEWQTGDPDRGASVPLAEDLDEEIGAAVDDPRVLAKVGNAEKLDDPAALDRDRRAPV